MTSLQYAGRATQTALDRRSRQQAPIATSLGEVKAGAPETDADNALVRASKKLKHESKSQWRPARTRTKLEDRRDLIRWLGQPQEVTTETFKALATLPVPVQDMIASYELETDDCVDATLGRRRCTRNWYFQLLTPHDERPVGEDEGKEAKVATPTPSATAEPAGAGDADAASFEVKAEPRTLDCSRYCMDDAKTMYEWLKAILKAPAWVLAVDTETGVQHTFHLSRAMFVELRFERAGIDHQVILSHSSEDNRQRIEVPSVPAELLQTAAGDNPFFDAVLQDIAELFEHFNVTCRIVIQSSEQEQISPGPLAVVRFATPYFGSMSRWRLKTSHRPSLLEFEAISSPRLPEQIDDAAAAAAAAFDPWYDHFVKRLKEAQANSRALILAADVRLLKAPFGVDAETGEPFQAASRRLGLLDPGFNRGWDTYDKVDQWREALEDAGVRRDDMPRRFTHFDGVADTAYPWRGHSPFVAF